MPAEGPLVQASESLGVWLFLSQRPPLHPLLSVPSLEALKPCLRPTHPSSLSLSVPSLEPLKPCLRPTDHSPLSLSVPSLEPLKPCLRPTDHSPLSQHLSRHASLTPAPWGDQGKQAEIPPRKRVVFADSKGLSLTAVRIFSELEEHPPCPPRLAWPPEPGGGTEGSLRRTVGRPRDRPRWGPGFPPPSDDLQVFRSRMREAMVLLENCGVSASALRGTVRVRNVSYRKDVHVRVTFDSWLSHRDVPCVYLRQLYGGRETDIFEFSVALPEVLDERGTVEFCVSYLPGGYSTAFWDNNCGQNYSLLCQ